jgi:hypothetical protein
LGASKKKQRHQGLLNNQIFRYETKYSTCRKTQARKS